MKMPPINIKIGPNTLVFILILLLAFCGEPDLWDAIIHLLMSI